MQIAATNWYILHEIYKMNLPSVNIQGDFKKYRLPTYCKLVHINLHRTANGAFITRRTESQKYSECGYQDKISGNAATEYFADEDRNRAKYTVS